MRTKTIVGLGLLGVLAGCAGGNGSASQEPGPTATTPTSPPSPTATAPQDDAGPPSAEDGGAGRSDAEAGGDGGSDAGSLITVNGVILGYGVPVAYAPVSIEGRPPIFTDASGKFSAAKVAVPYDLSVSLGTDDFLVLQGLTNPAPIVSTASGGTQSATLDGLVTYIFGSGSTQTGVLYVTPEGPRTDTAEPNGSFGYPNDAVWSSSGPSQQDVDVYTMSWGTDAIGKPGFWTGHAQASVQQGQTTSNVMIVESRTTQAAITGTIALPNGYAIQSFTAAWAPDPLTSTGGITFLEDSSGSTSFDVLAPQAGTIVLAASATPSDGAAAVGVLSLSTLGGSPVTVTVPQAPQIIQPIDGATGLSATDRLSWGPAPGLSVLTLDPTSGRNAPTVLLVTEDGSCTFPDLSAFGVTFPPGATYDWAVQGLTGLGSHPVDAITSGQTGELGVPVGVGAATSYLHKFTTAP